LIYFVYPIQHSRNQKYDAPFQVAHPKPVRYVNHLMFPTAIRLHNAKNKAWGAIDLSLSFFLVII